MAAKGPYGQPSQIPLASGISKSLSQLHVGRSPSQIVANVQKQSLIAFHCDQVGHFSF